MVSLYVVSEHLFFIVSEMIKRPAESELKRPGFKEVGFWIEPPE